MIIPVIYDLDKSKYISQYYDLKFYFSSDFYQKKFDQSLYDFIDHECIKLSAKYNVPINTHELKKSLAISLYKKVEKRGCKIVRRVQNGEDDKVEGT